MAAVHTKVVAIFNGQLINEAEDKIQYVKYRPSQPFDSNTPINFTIPGNSSQYVSLRESYMFVQCHVEQTDQFGNPITTSNTLSTPAVCFRRNVAKEVDNEEEEEEEEEGEEEDEEEDMDQEGEKPKVSRSVPNPRPFPASAKDIQQYLDEAECRYVKWQRVLTSFKNETNVQEKAKKKVLAESLEDMATLSMCQYLSAKYMRRKERLYQNDLVPIDNVLHSLWSGCDITMNGELVSMTNQKYMYKSYFETILNNSHSTKKYKLKMSGYFGDSGNKDVNFMQNWNKRMEERYVSFRNENKVELMGFLMSDIMGIQGAIVNGVEISITLIPNTDNIRLQSFKNNVYGRIAINDIYMYVCKRQFSKEVILAHADLMQNTEASYPFKKSEVRAYNGNKGNTEVIIEDPYESKIPTRILLGMIDADSYIGNWRKNPLNFQHYDIQRAAFYIDDESIAKPPYKLDPKNGQFIEPFMELYSILGKAGEDMDIGIDPNDFVNGMFILPFDVTPTSAANMEYLSKKEGGHCRIELQFKIPLPHNIIIITYAIFPNELRTDGARNCRVVPV